MVQPTRHRPTFWTAEKDQQLEELWSTCSTVEEVAEKLGIGRDAVQARAKNYLELPARPRGTTGFCTKIPLDREIPDDEMRSRDIAFQSAMLRAIERGDEHAPCGIDTTPCTKSPRPARMVEPLHSPTGSSAAFCVDN